ncbi:MAG: hypothetical protein QW168_01685 [Sulfolobales archaeon]
MSYEASYFIQRFKALSYLVVSRATGLSIAVTLSDNESNGQGYSDYEPPILHELFIN